MKNSKEYSGIFPLDLSHSATLGGLLRAARKQRHLTGGELGIRCGLSQSKISKIETGHFQPSDDDIQRLLMALRPSETILQRIQQQLTSIDGLHHDPRLRTYISKNSLGPECNAVTIRVYTATFIPALMQTATYRTALMQQFGLPESETSVQMKQLTARQDLLWEGSRRYHFVMPQTALYTTFGPKQMHLAQLDRLERMTTVPYVTVGIIPTEAGLLPVEFGSFSVYDDRLVINALTSHEYALENAADIELHISTFKHLQSLAFYGPEAVALIRQAANIFA